MPKSPGHQHGGMNDDETRGFYFTTSSVGAGYFPSIAA